jgi:hypothetical protein
MSSAASPHTLGPLLDARCLPWGGACDVPIPSYGHIRSLRGPGTNGLRRRLAIGLCETGQPATNRLRWLVRPRMPLSDSDGWS